jgi:Bifunctional DNA primase/polymerase, N-terminal
MNTLTDALSYAARGWQVFPLKPQAKEPATWRGFYDATSNSAILDRWFARGYPYNVAIRTGLASGVFVSDPDGT